jgi:restriction system protein
MRRGCDSRGRRRSSGRRPSGHKRWRLRKPSITARWRRAVDLVARPATEIKQRYARLIACIALRTLHEIFRSTPNEILEAIVFNGRVSTIDKATGKQARPHLISVEAERSAFDDLVLAEVDPAACLKHLNALVSPNPFDLEAVEPFIAFDLKRFRFVDGTDELADLDSRRNLLKLSPTEFEYLVKDLFVAMGAEAWRTVPSKDGGVDAVATARISSLVAFASSRPSDGPGWSAWKQCTPLLV